MNEEEIKAMIAQWRAQDRPTRRSDAILFALPAPVVTYMVDHDLLTVEEQHALMQWSHEQEELTPPP